MTNEDIIVANIKCNGCATTIKNELQKIEGVQNATAHSEKDMVSVSYDAPATRQQLIARLHALGYPEATEKNGLLLQLKSYTSCMIGKVNNFTKGEQ